METEIALDTIAITLKYCNTEMTSCPFWIIIDPSQDGKLQMHGIWFCREDAENYLEENKYNYNKKAYIYCMSGHRSEKYYDLCKSLNKH